LEAKQFGTRDNKAVPFKWTDHSGCKWLNASMHIEEQHAPTESWPKSQPKGRKKGRQIGKEKAYGREAGKQGPGQTAKGINFRPCIFSTLVCCSSRRVRHKRNI